MKKKGMPASVRLNRAEERELRSLRAKAEAALEAGQMNRYDDLRRRERKLRRHFRNRAAWREGYRW